MGCFYTDVTVLNVKDESQRSTVSHLPVDSGAESSWIPRSVLEQLGVERRKKDQRFQMANGQVITRGIGYAVIKSGEYETVDEVVFAEDGDLPLLGARTLEGFNATVDPVNKRLVAAGPIPAAGNVRRSCILKMSFVHCHGESLILLIGNQQRTTDQMQLTTDN